MTPTINGAVGCATLAALITSAGELARRWSDLSPQETKAYLGVLVRRIVIKQGSVVIEIDPDRVVEAIMVGCPAGLATKPRRGQRGSPHIALEIPATLERAGMGVRLVVQGEVNDSSPDHSLIRLLIRAFAIRDRL